MTVQRLGRYKSATFIGWNEPRTWLATQEGLQQNNLPFDFAFPRKMSFLSERHYQNRSLTSYKVQYLQATSYTQLEQVVDAPNLTSFTYGLTKSSSPGAEKSWEFPLRSATRLEALLWRGPGIAVPVQALEACKMLTSIDLISEGTFLPHSHIQQWPRIPELTRLELETYIPGGPYIVHPFTKFTK